MAERHTRGDRSGRVERIEEKRDGKEEEDFHV
jgi:hypothetical protein